MHNYSSYSKFFVSVDCVIFGYSEGHLHVLIHERPYEPAYGELSLIGGFVEEDEDLETAAKRILKNFTGIDNVYMQQLSAFGEVGRDPGERVISIVYFVLVNLEDCETMQSIDSKTRWVDVDKLPELCFDHNEMVKKSRRVLGEEIKNSSIGKYLLSEYFTLSKLQSLYEAISGQQFDKRNFRRSIAEKDYIKVTDMIDKDSSRRGASLYTFV